MIKIEKPYIEYEENSAVLNAYISIDAKRELVWFKVEEKFGQYLCDERGDAFVIAVLDFAMRNGHDIVSDAPVTEDLLYNVETYLIEGLVDYNPHFHKTKILAEVATTLLPCAGAVGTGISCGVDSLNSLACESSDRFPKHKITHLCFNNVGSHGEGEAARILYQKRIERPRKFAEEYGYEFVASDSNIMDVVKQNHFKTHTYSSMFAVYCLQKLFSIYYYASSGHRFSEFSLEDKSTNGSGTYELLSLPVFSTHQLRVYSQGDNMTRLRKLSNVVNYKPSYKYLNVCLKDGDNCGKCEKCVRTILGLEALGKLEEYRMVFDVDYFYGHKKWYLRQMLIQLAENKHDYFEIYPYFKSQMTADLYFYKIYLKAKYFIVEVVKNIFSGTKSYEKLKKIYHGN